MNIKREQIINWQLYIFMISMLSGASILHAQSNLKITTESYSAIDGLSDNFVSSIAQDQKGFLWIGTHAGLNRFDGYSFLPLKPSQENYKSFSEENIYNLLVDGENLWICSGTGIFTYNLETGSLRKNIFVDKYLNDLSPPFTNIYRGRDSLFWLVSDTIIVLTGPAQGTVNELEIYKQVILRDSGYSKINDLYQGKFNDLWVGTSTALHSLLISNDLTKQYLSLESIYLNEPIEKIEPLDENNIWIIHSGNNISRINIHQNTLYTLDNLMEGFPPDASMIDIKSDNKGGIWIAGSIRGVHRYDVINSTYTHHLFDRLDKIEYIYENYVTRLFKDRSDCIWACTQGGLAKVSIIESNFRVFSDFEKNVYNEPPGDISTISIDSSGYIWASHWLDRPFRFRVEDNQFIDATPQVIKNHQNSNDLLQRIPAIFIHDKHRIWFCTSNGHGILEYYFDKNDERFLKQYLIKDGLPTDSVNFAFLDSRDNIWVGTTQGISLYDNDNRFFFSRINNSGKIFEINKHILCMEQTKSHLWFGSTDGSLIKYRITDNSDSDSNPEIINMLDDWIMSIKQSGDTILWLGTMDGLYKYKINSALYEKFEDENITNYSVAEIQIGKDGILWLGTLTGLVRMNPITSETHKFYAGSGVRINHINWRASAQDKEGSIYFGSKAGLIYFNPDNVTKYTKPPDLVISRFLVDNVSWPIEQFSTDDQDFDYSIVLPFNNNNLSFEFNALSYLEQDKNQYQYRLSGLNELWNTVDYRGRLINYSNLSPGNYIFEVNASNYEGIWNQQPLKINILIKQVFWKSNMAILFYILFISAISYLLILELKMRKRLREDLLHEKFERKNIEKINELKLRFFTNITHEFRSPLTMIINPVDKLISGEFRPAVKKELYRIKENAGRVLSLINQILDFRKVTAKGLTPYFRKGDINIFLKRQLDRFRASNINNQQLIFKSNLKDGTYVFDSFILEKIVSNLISNASKFSSEGSKIVLSVKNALDEGSREGILISVEDEGRGIPKEYLDKVFDRFFQIGKNEAGSGIGLSLVHELVKNHQGSISLESKINEGSCFNVFLPRIPEEEKMVQDSAGSMVLKSFKALAASSPENKLKAGSLKKSQLLFKYKILVIEDDEELLEYLSEELNSLYVTYKASNGKDALDIIDRIHPDLIISDVIMPEMNGWDLCRKIKSDIKYSHIPVILLTVENSDLSRELGYDSGADSYLEKPISLNTLHKRIQNILKTRELARIKYQKTLSVEPTEIITTSMDEQFLKKALGIVEKNIDNPDFNNDAFCQELGVSSTQLYKKLKFLLGISGSEFIKDIRLKRAAQLLKSNNNNISEVAYMCGFSDPKYFSKCFKKQFGVNPKRYAKTNKMSIN